MSTNSLQWHENKIETVENEIAEGTLKKDLCPRHGQLEDAEHIILALTNP
jgi:hypothetical protein